MNSKNILVGAIVLCVSLVLGYVGGSFAGNGEGNTGGMYNVNTSQFINGLSAGPSNQFSVSETGNILTRGGLVEGGILTISTTGSTYTLTNALMKGVKVISIADTGTSTLALTLPASSTLSMIPNAGDTMEFVVDNLHTVAATTTTITAGAGTDIDGTTANDDVVNGDASARLECFRLVNTNVRCIVEEMVDAG